MQYTYFSAEDFAKDAFFIRWVNTPDAETEWFWNSFIKEHPEKVATIEEGRKIVNTFRFQSHKLSPDTLGAMRNRLLMSIKAEKEIQKENEFALEIPEKISKSPWRWLKVAAMICVPLLVLSLYFTSTTNNTSAVKSVTKSTEEERVNPRGQKSVLFLEDGTKVWLNADSKLNYDKNFHAMKTREVYLEGEAFFDVAHNSSKPFIVHTSALSVRVLGTAFNVKSYEDEKTIETTLLRGKVSIVKAGEKSNGSLLLNPNQKAVYVKTTRLLNVETVDASTTTPWRLDKLVFDETPMSEVFVQLERWYNVEIHLTNQDTLTCNLSADIEKESLEDVLKLLKTSHHITYTIEGNVVEIQGDLCK